MHKLTKEALEKKLAEISQNISNHPSTAISTNLVDYSIIKNHFPNEVKYLWSIDKTFSLSMFKRYVQTRKALRDPKMEVLLVRINRKKGNR